MAGVKQRSPASLPPYAQWFQLVDPGLLTNKAIRQHLLTYNADKWPEVVKLTLLYGILSLRKQYGPQALALRDLRDIIGQNKVAASVEQSIPGLEKQLADLRAEVLSFQQELGGEEAAQSQPLVRQAVEASYQTQPPLNTADQQPSVLPERQRRVSFANREPSRLDRQTPQPTVAQPRVVPTAGQTAVGKRIQSPLENGNPGVHFQKIDRTLTSKKTGGEAKPEVHFARVVKEPVVRGRAYIPSGDEALAMALKQAAIAAAKMHGEGYEPVDEEDEDSAVNYPDWYAQKLPEMETAPPQGPDYPNWWGHEAFVPRPRKAKKAPRAPPRLAYSVPREDTRARQVLEDDLVTAQYLLVPGSGYGQEDVSRRPLSETGRLPSETGRLPTFEAPEVSRPPAFEAALAGDVNTRQSSGQWLFGPEGAAGIAGVEIGGERPSEVGEVLGQERQASVLESRNERRNVQSAGDGSSMDARAASSGSESSRKHSSGWVATIPVADVGRKPKKSIAFSKQGAMTPQQPESVTVERVERAESDRSRREQSAERGVQGERSKREEAHVSTQGERGRNAPVRKRTSVKSRVREEIEARRKYEEQKAAARLRGAQDLLARAQRRSPEGTPPAEPAVPTPLSAVGRIADSFLADPWMAHFQEPTGSTTPAFERFGLSEAPPEPSFVPSGSLLAAAAAASVLLTRRGPQAEEPSARSHDEEPQAAPQDELEERQEDHGLRDNEREMLHQGLEEIPELEEGAVASEQGEEERQQEVEEEGSPGTGEEEVASRREEVEQAARNEGEVAGTSALALEGSSGRGRSSPEAEERRRTEGSEASDSPSLSSFTSFTTSGSLESGFQSTADSAGLA